MFHEACEKCGSSDGKAVYDNNTAWCFACKTWFKDGDMDETDHEAPQVVGKQREAFLEGTYQDIKNRGLKEEICQKFGYTIGEDKGQPCHIASYRDPKTGRLVGQKIRKSGKDFRVIKDKETKLPFFGQHLYNGGKRLTITEGEIDALSTAQAMGMGKWPVVSLPNGASSALKTIQENYDWLDTFEEIVLCFDNDEAGAAALEEALPALPVGKAYTMTLPEKDANATLLALGPEAISNAFWNRTQWRPDGIVSGADISLDSLKSAINRGYSTRYPLFNERYGGIRKREILLLTAGSGIGKSTLAREFAYGLLEDHGLTIGNVFLEESKEKTAQGYIALHNNIPLGKLRVSPEMLTERQWADSYEKTVNSGHLYFYDHFGSLESDRLLGKLRYMATALKCDFIVLDHISIVVSGQEGSGEGERRDIDKLMTSLRSLVEETGVGVIAIVHLKQPEGKAHEEGGRVTLSQLRGSGSLKQLPDGVLAMERDQQGGTSDTSLMRLLKNREFGDTGEIDTIRYDKITGRLDPTEAIGEGFDELDV